MQIYSMISDIWLIYNVLYYTFHRLSSCFTAGGKTQGGKTGKSEEKARKSTGLKGWKRTGTHEWQAPGQEKTAGTPRNRQGENRIMQSCERAVFSPRFLVPLYKTGRRFCMGDMLIV